MDAVKRICLAAILVSGGMARAAEDRTTALPAKEWRRNTRVWLARACVGEAGWDAPQRRECAAIAEAVKLRWLTCASRGCSYLSVLRAYSAPIREARRSRSRPWILDLDTRLRGRLKRYQPKWDAVLTAVDAWYRGEVRSPCPGADHFGGSFDSPHKRWTRVQCETPVLNLYYSSVAVSPGK